MLARLGNTLYWIGFIGAALIGYSSAGVEVQHDFMVVGVTGPCQAEFLAFARQMANDKARELGWIA
jgi:hypothetical protein